MFLGVGIGIEFDKISLDLDPDPDTDLSFLPDQICLWRTCGVARMKLFV